MMRKDTGDTRNMTGAIAMKGRSMRVNRTSEKKQFRRAIRGNDGNMSREMKRQNARDIEEHKRWMGNKRAIRGKWAA